MRENPKSSRRLHLRLCDPCTIHPMQLSDLPAAAHIRPAEWGRVVVLSTLILLGINSLYWLAYATPTSHVFGGILFNPIDGASYLAKMREGWRGEWLFTLPYTAQPGPGVFIYTYYLSLGHIARWTGAGIELVYHLVRTLGGLALLLSAYHFVARFFEPPRRLAVWLFFSLTSGLGWLYFILRTLFPWLPEPPGVVTSDLWVAELIPFLSLFASSHFCITAALMLWVFEWTLPGLADSPPSARRLTLTAVAVTLMAQTQPLALITVGLVLGALTLWRITSSHTLIWIDLLPPLVVAAFALPWLIYDYWIAAAHPVLRVWNAQNLTPSPPTWDALISGGLPLLLALPGINLALRRRWPHDVLLLFWFGLTVLALYAPFALQRRLSLGLWMPISLLAGIGFGDVIWPRLARLGRLLVLGLFAIGALTGNLLIGLSTFVAIQKHAPEIFLAREEAAAMAWLEANAAPGSLVLAGPATGLFIPARTDARVIYGHDFETIDAKAQKQAVEDFYGGRIAPETFFTAYPVDYVFYGPREARLGSLPQLAGWRVVFQQGEVVIYGR